MERRKTYAITFSALAVVLLALADLMAGGVSLGFGEVFRGLTGHGAAADIVLGIRLPRMLTALVCGASLALGGAQMQAVFRNPLADPHIMGVSGGAGLGAAVAAVSLAGTALLAVSAFAGALAASALVLIASSKFRSGNTLLLFGVMLGFIFSAITSVLQYTAGEEGLKLFYSWAAGTFTSVSMSQDASLCGALCIGLLLAVINAKGLDIILFGEEYTALAGASSRRIRFLAILSCCVMTGVVTAFCGPLGFVGIVAPHAARFLCRTSVHRAIIPASILCGAILALLADIFSQLPAIHTPLPAGSTLALLGIPLILVIMLSSRRN